MKRFTQFIIGLLAIVLLGQSLNDAQASPCTDNNNVIINNGACWISLVYLQKLGIIEGIWEGERIKETSNDLIGQKASHWFSMDHSLMPAGTTTKDIINYFDELYSYPVNRKIVWKYAYLLSALKMNDDDSNDRLALLRFLRDYGELPTVGYWIKTVNLDTIIVQSGTNKFTVKLLGVSSNNIDNNILSTALNSMNALQKSGFGNKCDDIKISNATVVLSYPLDFFDKSGHLDANVQIINSVTCVNSKIVRLEDIFGKSSYLYLNQFLLSKGLARPDNHFDPAWSKTRRSYMGLILFSVKAAEKKGLYIFGGRKDRWVELISEKKIGTAY